MTNQPNRHDDNHAAHSYDAQAEGFDTTRYNNLPWAVLGGPTIRSFILTLAEESGVPLEELTVLNVGCGTGRVEEALVKLQLAASNLHRIDISKREIEIAISNVPGANFDVGDIREYDKVPAESLHAVISHMVFEFLNDDELLAALRIIRKALKPGMALEVVTTHPERYLAKFPWLTDHMNGTWFDLKGPWLPDESDKSMKNWFRTKERFLELLEQAGFTVTTTEELYILPEHRDVLPERFDRIQHKDAPSRLVISARRPAA